MIGTLFRVDIENSIILRGRTTQKYRRNTKYMVKGHKQRDLMILKIAKIRPKRPVVDWVSYGRRVSLFECLLLYLE